MNGSAPAWSSSRHAVGAPSVSRRPDSFHPAHTAVTTARIALRPLEPADAAAVRAMLASPEVATWWGPVPEGFPATDEPDATRLVIRAGDTGCGRVQYGDDPPPGYGDAWIGIFVAPAVRGRRLGTAALRAIVEHLVRERGHHRIT